ncbi:MAG: hypothetical protein IBJ11_12230 [Phycisphaerales bacterium]|nr:hypothetical protein [Phycisphaerales bacterium]
MTARVRRWVGRGLLALVAAASLTVLPAWWLAGQRPGWWVSTDRSDPAAVATAEAVERGVMAALSGERAPGRAWTVEVTEGQLAAWLNVRLPRWLANRDVPWPDRVGAVCARIDEWGVTLGAEVRDGGTEGRARVLGLSASPRVEGGALRLARARVHVGRLPAPMSLAGGRVGALVRTALGEEGAQRAGEILRGERPLAEPAELRLEDGRRVRLLGVELRPGRALLTLTTEPARP